MSPTWSPANLITRGRTVILEFNKYSTQYGKGVTQGSPWAITYWNRQSGFGLMNYFKMSYFFEALRSLFTFIVRNSDQIWNYIQYIIVIIQYVISSYWTVQKIVSRFSKIFWFVVNMVGWIWHMKLSQMTKVISLSIAENVKKNWL